MNILKDIAETFSVSKPVFTAELDPDGTQVNFIVERVQVPFCPEEQVVTDPVIRLVGSRFSQRFETNTRRFVVDIHLPSVYSDIMDTIAEFYRNSSPLKNPTQSRLFKWLKSISPQQYYAPPSEGFIALYRYIENEGAHGCDADVVRNVLAILEMMREKYESK